MPDTNGNPVPGDPNYVPSNQSGGLINAQPTTTPSTMVAPSAAATASTAAATPFTVAPNQTVASNIEGIIAKDSPLLQQANARAMDRVNARGLLDSSIGISAGQSALYDAALPIAQQDAQTYNQAATNTAQAKNTADLTNAQLGTNVNLANAGAINTANLQTAQNATTLSVADKQAATSKYNADLAATNARAMQDVDNAFKTAQQTTDIAGKVTLQNLQSETQKALAQIQLTGNTVMQTSTSATNIFNTGMSMIRDVIADSTIPPASKTSLVNGYLQWMQQGMNVIGNVNHVDVSDLLDFSTINVGP